MRFAFSFAFLAFFVAFAGAAHAQLGAPSYSFSLANAANYPGHAFYYAVDESRLEAVETGTNVFVYRFGAAVTVYAVPRTDVRVNGGFVDFQRAIRSKPVALAPGMSVLEVVSLDEAAKQLDVRVVFHEPEAGPFSESFIRQNVLPFLNAMLGVLAVVVLALGAVFVALPYLRRKKAKEAESLN